MKIGVYGGQKKEKDKVVRTIAEELGLSRQKRVLLGVLKKYGDGAKTMSAMRDRQELLFICAMEAIGQLQVQCAMKNNFVAPETFMDILDPYLEAFDKDAEEPVSEDRVDGMRLLAHTGLSYYDIFAVFPGTGLVAPQECLDKTRIVFGEGLSDMEFARQVIKVVQD